MVVVVVVVIIIILIIIIVSITTTITSVTPTTTKGYKTVQFSLFDKENGEWTILNVYGKTVSRTIGGDLFTPVYVYVELQRRPFFYVMTVLFPMMMLSVLSSCSFCVSGANGEKLTFALTVLLSQVKVILYCWVLLVSIDAMLHDHINTYTSVSIYPVPSPKFYAHVHKDIQVGRWRAD